MHSGLGNSSTSPLLELLDSVSVAGISIFGVSANYAQSFPSAWPCNAALRASASMADLKPPPFPFEWAQLNRSGRAPNTELRPRFPCTSLGETSSRGLVTGLWSPRSSSTAQPASGAAAGPVQLSHSRSGNPAGGGLHSGQFGVSLAEV